MEQSVSRRTKPQPRCPHCQKFVKREAEACRSCGEHLPLSVEEPCLAQSAPPKFPPLRSIFPVMDYYGEPLPMPAQLMPGLDTCYFTPNERGRRHTPRQHGGAATRA
jgi:hypothetical protein